MRSFENLLISLSLLDKKLLDLGMLWKASPLKKNHDIKKRPTQKKSIITPNPEKVPNNPKLKKQPSIAPNFRDSS
jgi:hypothetical protein